VSGAIHLYDVHIYYEDTDLSGFVYHPRYLHYFERAREHALGTDELARLWREEGKGFVVHKAALVFKDGAAFGDVVEIRSTGRIESEYRVTFEQKAHRKVDGKLLVEATFELVCVDAARKLVPIPASAKELAARGPTSAGWSLAR
jgi:tol-pal system-associated acyl-CoA thioesterase